MFHFSDDTAVLVARIMVAYGTSSLLIKLSAFIGVAMMFVGGFSVDQYLVGLRPNWFIDAIVWPM